MKGPSRALRRIVEREASWFFGRLGGNVPEGVDPAVAAAAERFTKWLREVPAFHRGVLSLRFVRRPWPKYVEHEFEELSSVVVRLECALHPAVGQSTEALEAASLERLQEALRLCEPRKTAGREQPFTRAERDLAALANRAARHVELAIRALARVRGLGPCLVPVARAK